jgi:hypothetical protein
MLGNALAAPLELNEEETEFMFVSDRPMFTTDVDIYLGQKRRGGGRVWGNFYYGDTTLKPTEDYKIRPSFYGVQLGFDVKKSHGVYSTYFINLNQSKIKFGGASSTIDNYLIGYGKFIYLSMCHFTFSGSLGYDRYAISAEGSPKGDGLQTNIFGEFGLDFIFGKWAIKPFYALHYDFLYHGNIGERGRVFVGDWNGHGLNQLVGLRLNWQATKMLELQGRAVWVHEMLDNPPPFYHARFSPVHGIHTPAIMFYEGNTGRDWVWFGIGGKLEPWYDVKMYFDYDVLFNKQHITHLGSIGLCLGW